MIQWACSNIGNIITTIVLVMETESTSETSGDIYQTTQRNVSQDS